MGMLPLVRNASKSAGGWYEGGSRKKNPQTSVSGFSLPFFGALLRPLAYLCVEASRKVVELKKETSNRYAERPAALATLGRRTLE